MKHERRNKRIKRLQREAKMQREKRRAADTEIIRMHKEVAEVQRDSIEALGQLSVDGAGVRRPREGRALGAGG